jgi:hypothetical protein
MLARKAATKELGTGPRDAALDALIEAELEAATSTVDEPAEERADLLAQANDLFRLLVNDR